MNFIELQPLQSCGGFPIFINLSTVTIILPKHNGTTLCLVGGETINVENSYDEIRSTIETMQRRK